MRDRSPHLSSSSSDAAPAEMLDLRGLKCPLPVLHTRRALARMTAGAVIDVRCTDPLAGLDIPNLVRETGDLLLSGTRLDGETRFRIVKAGSASGRATFAREDPSVAAGVDQAQ